MARQAGTTWSSPCSAVNLWCSKVVFSNCNRPQFVPLASQLCLGIGQRLKSCAVKKKEYGSKATLGLLVIVPAKEIVK